MTKTLFILVPNLFILTSVYASPFTLGSKDCENNNNAAHCSYTDFDIKPENQRIGKYVKVTLPRKNLSMIACLNQDSGNTLYYSNLINGINNGLFEVGDNNSFEYQQCSDAFCQTKLSFLQKDQFSIYKINENQYKVTPKMFTIRIYRNYGEDCVA